MIPSFTFLYFFAIFSLLNIFLFILDAVMGNRFWRTTKVTRLKISRFHERERMPLRILLDEECIRINMQYINSSNLVEDFGKHEYDPMHDGHYMDPKTRMVIYGAYIPMFQTLDLIL